MRKTNVGVSESVSEKSAQDKAHCRLIENSELFKEYAQAELSPATISYMEHKLNEMNADLAVLRGCST